MASVVGILLRGFALVWTLLITALIGNVIASNRNAAGSAEAAVNFTIFVAAWAWLANLWGLAAAVVSSLALPIVVLSLDGIATLLTFIDAIVLASMLRAIDCRNINEQYLPSNWIAFGSADNQKRCEEIQASTAFMWFLWACMTGCLVLTILDSRGGFGLGFGRRGGSSRPSMSQVGV